MASCVFFQNKLFIVDMGEDYYIKIDHNRLRRDNERPPKIGDRVTITDYSGFDPNEAVKVSKAEEVIITHVERMPVGPDINGGYWWSYIIYIDIVPGQLVTYDQYRVIR